MFHKMMLIGINYTAILISLYLYKPFYDFTWDLCQTNWVIIFNGIILFTLLNFGTLLVNVGDFCTTST